MMYWETGQVFFYDLRLSTTRVCKEGDKLQNLGKEEDSTTNFPEASSC